MGSYFNVKVSIKMKANKKEIIYKQLKMNN